MKKRFQSRISKKEKRKEEKRTEGKRAVFEPSSGKRRIQGLANRYAQRARKLTQRRTHRIDGMADQQERRAEESANRYAHRAGKLTQRRTHRAEGSRSRNASHIQGLADRYAHRGYHQKPEIPENSLAAFRRAIDHGLPAEIDVHLIADGTLVVFHDELLERETGADGEIEDYNITELRKLRLEGTDEMIPTFDEVLELYEDTGLPLLIELKVNRGNHRELTEAVCQRLDSYQGEFALQSFDPRVLFVLKKLRPGFTRGQLSKNFFASTEGLPFYQVALLTNLALNVFTRPDFINYKFTDRGNHTLRWWRDRKGMTEMSWTLRSADELKDAIAAGGIPIFENIAPEELKKIFEHKGNIANIETDKGSIAETETDTDIITETETDTGIITETETDTGSIVNTDTDTSKDKLHSET